MDMIPTAIAAQFALWYRRRAGERWTLVAQATSESELSARTLALPSGDQVVVRLGEDPNRRRRGFLCS